MAKPDALKRALLGDIIRRFEVRGFQLLQLKMVQSKDIEDIIPLHYEEHKGKSFYLDLVRFSLSGPVCAMVWSGNIEVARLLVGSTAPQTAVPGSIRGDYACVLPENLIHCSDTPESAAREIELWSKIFV
jgi:nucleoside-diphosphate kinase